MKESLEISREARILRVTLARPEKRNALSTAMCGEIVDACENAEADSSIGAILIDSKGDVFCAGMDLDEVLEPDAADRTAIHERLFTLGARLTKPLIAAVRGPALGGGAGLAATAHIAIAAQGSTFGLTEIRIGMWPYVIFRAVVQAIGERRAVELSLTGKIFNVPEALQWGLIHEAAPAFELDDRATAIALHMAAQSTQAVSRGLDFVHRTRTIPAQDAGVIAREMRAEAFASEDFREGVSAFREKRKPQWKIG